MVAKSQKCVLLGSFRDPWLDHHLKIGRTSQIRETPRHYGVQHFPAPPAALFDPFTTGHRTKKRGFWKLGRRWQASRFSKRKHVLNYTWYHVISVYFRLSTSPLQRAYSKEQRERKNDGVDANKATKRPRYALGITGDHS